MKKYRCRILNPVMGVPITFLSKYNPDEWEIVAFRKGSDGKDLVFSVERERENISVLSDTHTKNWNKSSRCQQRVWCQVWRLTEGRHIEDCWLDENDMIYHAEPCISIEKYKLLGHFVPYKSRQLMYKGRLCQKTYHRIFIMRKKDINLLLNK